MSDYRRARLRLALEPITQAAALAAMFAAILTAAVLFG